MPDTSTHTLGGAPVNLRLLALGSLHTGFTLVSHSLPVAQEIRGNKLLNFENRNNK